MGRGEAREGRREGGWEGGDGRTVLEEGLSRVSDWQQGRERVWHGEKDGVRAGMGKGGWDRGGNL